MVTNASTSATRNRSDASGRLAASSITPTICARHEIALTRRNALYEARLLGACCDTGEERRRRDDMSDPAAPRSDTKDVTGESRVAKLFGLSGENWMRHANPLSVWTRFTVLSLISLAIWSRDWIGWYCLIPIALSLVWMMINPLLFPPPSSTKNWASKGVFGEHVWSERNAVEIPEQFKSPVSSTATSSGDVARRRRTPSVARATATGSTGDVVSARLRACSKAAR